MAEGATIANAFVQIMPSAEGATSAITDSILPSMEGLGQEAGSNIGGGILDSLKGFAGPIAGVLAGLGIGKALLDIGTEFDSMTDTIILGTGASGEALDELSECIAQKDDIPTEREERLCELLDSFLATLPKRTRRVFLRRYWYASSISEIAKDYGMSENNVTVMLYRTRKALADILQKEGFLNE